jgi:hypothetical protein
VENHLARIGRLVSAQHSLDVVRQYGRFLMDFQGSQSLTEFPELLGGFRNYDRQLIVRLLIAARLPINFPDIGNQTNCKPFSFRELAIAAFKSLKFDSHYPSQSRH